MLRSLLPLLSLATLAMSQHPLGSAMETKAHKFVAKAERELHENAKWHVLKEWAFASNITEHNEKVKIEAQKKSKALTVRLAKMAKHFDLKKIDDKVLERKLMLIARMGTSALPQNKLERFLLVVNEMEKIFSTARVPSFRVKDEMLRYEPDLVQIFSSSRDPAELAYYWTEWRSATGDKMRDLYNEYADLINDAARLNEYKDGSLMWVAPYESETFIEDMATTWEGIKPLYLQLHAYVRHKLAQRYGEDVVNLRGGIPAHLLGNMWAQGWANLADILRPYPDKPDVDITEAMNKQGWTPITMFQKADEFFQSIGFEPMTDVFWKKSILEKPQDGRELVCHASAWDFYVEDDFRIKQCTRVDGRDFVTVNHEMGHIQYQMQYRNQSYLFRDGANPGFHEGVADILSLAAGTAGYAKRLGLLDSSVDVEDKETDTNILFFMALHRLAFLPFGYLVDKYRWDVFSGRTSREDLNCHWVKLRREIQGIEPPNVRDESHFDPGSKYHVAADIGYVRYFTAYIYEFQFFRELCQVSGQYEPDNPDKPLHRCNFYGSKEAGAKLSEMLRLGSSRPWQETIAVMTGGNSMDTSAFREYFRPLEMWLKEENAKNNVQIGWDDDHKQFCAPQNHKINSGGGHINHEGGKSVLFGIILALVLGFIAH